MILKEGEGVILAALVVIRRLKSITVTTDAGVLEIIKAARVSALVSCILSATCFINWNEIGLSRRV